MDIDNEPLASLPVWLRKAVVRSLLDPIRLFAFLILVLFTALSLGALQYGVGIHLGFHTRVLVALLLWIAIFYIARKIGRSIS